MKIVIDPGHGLKPNGKFSRPLMKSLEGYSYREDLGTLEIAKYMAEFLNKEGIEVHLTREDERNVQLFMREKYELGKWRSVTSCIKWFTKKINPDIFISIHTNAGGGSGPVAFITSFKDEESKKLSEMILEEMCEEFKVGSRGIKEKGFSIIKNKQPSILLEVLFHDNDYDLNLLINKKKQIAKVLSRCIKKFSVSY
jgi:N-acetylmuramoyl-L-alanine amidase